MTDDKWEACKHITGGIAKSALLGLEKIVVCRPCAVSGIEKLYPIGKNQLVESLARVGIKKVLSLDDVFPKKVDKSDMHPCNACERNESNIILLSIDAEPVCKDLSDCPYMKLSDKP